MLNQKFAKTAGFHMHYCCDLHAYKAFFSFISVFTLYFEVIFAVSQVYQGRASV